MAIPTLTPSSTTSAITLPSSGSTSNVAAACPYGMYTGSVAFISGASTQVAHTYKKLGGDVLDIELTEGNVYANYEESVLEYSYIVNIHQAKNSLSDYLGNTTGSFNHKGELTVGDPLSASLDGRTVALKLPRFEFEYSKNVTRGIGTEAVVGGTETVYSASFSVKTGHQEYDLQSIIYSASVNSSNSDYMYYSKVGKNRIEVRRVYYKTPHAMWRFFGYYGGLSVLGNMHYYGQYSDESTFEVVPVWQNKLQAIQFEDAINVRLSHFSYELKNNKLKIFPPGNTSMGPSKMWVDFTVRQNAWEEDQDKKTGIRGVNNMNTLPFANIPYNNINSIGKQWIRRFALALSKETLGQIRSKFGTIPIPGENLSLNGDALLTQGKEEQDKLREELKTTLDELTYAKLTERDSIITENTVKLLQGIPNPIFLG